MGSEYTYPEIDTKIHRTSTLHIVTQCSNSRTAVSVRSAREGAQMVLEAGCPRSQHLRRGPRPNPGFTYYNVEMFTALADTEISSNLLGKKLI
jgi:hypothetical protein